MNLRCVEGDWVYFISQFIPPYRLLFKAVYVDESHVYLRRVGDKEVDFRADIGMKEMRKFTCEGWALQEGYFEAYEDH